jgi:dihydrodipicolinate synthase/N-acetylneuraminate lyase
MLMGRLTSRQLRGIWAGVALSWDEFDHFDELSYRNNIQSMCEAGVHGIYTSGSTGEFYALDWDEFRRMVDIQDEICSHYGLPVQIGCCADSTRKVLRLVDYATSKAAIGAVQVTLPYWMELSDREVLRFFEDLGRTFPDMPLVHYNISRAKRFLHGIDYLRVLEKAPNLIGVKYTFSGAHFGDLQCDIQMTPQLAYLVGEDLLASAMLLGASGSCSSLVLANPEFMLTMYDFAAQGRWEEAVKMQQVVARFFGDAVAFVAARGEGTIDPVFDKGLAVAAGGTAGAQRTRAPYIGWSDETVIAMRQWMQHKYPQFLFETKSGCKMPAFVGPNAAVSEGGEAETALHG